MAATVVALVTSMAWFPAPERSDPAVISMLAAEREYLLGKWGAAKIATAFLVPLMFIAIAVALWRRSVVWALVVINAAVLFKIAWTFWYGDTAGTLAHLPAALAGLAVVDGVMAVVIRRLRRRTGPASVAVPTSEAGVVR